MAKLSLNMLAIIDPIPLINIKKDTTIALLNEAQQRGIKINITLIQNLFLQDGQVYALTNKVTLHDSITDWITFDAKEEQPQLLTDFDIVLMRKDPPFGLSYLHATYLLDLAQKAGCFIVNNPQSLRDCNEKLFTLWFPQCCPPTLVTARLDLLFDFLKTNQKIIVKPLHNMGGQGIFLLEEKSPNLFATIELLTQKGQILIMAQKFLPEIIKGDKRILMIKGKPYPYALLRVPKEGDIRGNLAQGAKGVGATLEKRDLWLCEQIGPTLVEKGLLFVGLDVIGDYITEINVTSPTCVKEISSAFQVNVAAFILDELLKAYSQVKALR